MHKDVRSALALTTLALAVAATAAAENSVTVESRQVATGRESVNVGIFIANDRALTGLVIPLEIRSITPGAFIAGSFDIHLTRRLAVWSALEFQTTRLCGAPDERNLCSGPISHTWSTPYREGIPDGFFESPCAVMWAGVSAAEPDLEAGSDATGEPSVVLEFGITQTEGRFEIDTCCVAPGNHLEFVDDQFNSILPTFTRGIITVGEPTNLPNNAPFALCHDMVVLAGAAPSVAIRASDLDAGSYDPDRDLIVMTLIPPGPYVLGDHDVQFIVSDGTLADTCIARIVVTDGDVPVARCHDTTIELRGDTSADIEAADIDAGSHLPASDSCTVRLEPGGPYPCGEHIVLFIVSDGDIADTCIATIRVAENGRPVVHCRDTVVNLRGRSQAEMVAADIGSGSYDPDGDTLAMALEPPGPFPPGDHSVHLVVSDGEFTDSCTALITVRENRVPVARCTDIVVDDPTLCEVHIPASEVGAGSFDPDDDPITLTLDPPGPYLFEDNPVRLMVSDGLLADTCEAMIIVTMAADPYVVCPGTVIPDFRALYPGTNEVTRQCVIPDLTHRAEICARGRSIEIEQDPPPGWFLVPDLESITLRVIVDQLDTTHCQVMLDKVFWPYSEQPIVTGFPLVVANVDILPGTCPNRIETNDWHVGEDVLSAVVLGSEAVVVSRIAASSLKLWDVRPLRWRIVDIAAPNRQVSRGRCVCMESVADGYPDLLLEYDWQTILSELGPLGPDTLIPMTVSGTIGDVELTGGDCLRLVAVDEFSNPETVIGAAAALQPLDNYPNPFNSGTVIRFGLSREGPVTVEIFNVLGQRVRTLIDNVLPAGTRQITWDGKDHSGRPLASGLYLCRLKAEGRTEGRKIVLAR